MNQLNPKFTLLILCLLVFNYSAFSQVQEREPNNTFATADTINILSEKSGTVQSSSDPDDYFRTVFSADGTLKIYIRGTNAGTSNAYLYIYGYNNFQANGQVFGRYVATQSAAPGASIVDTLTFYGRGADTFYFRFVTSGTFSYNYKYNIVDVTPNDVEPNNTFAQATTINRSEIKRGHSGYFKLTRVCGGIGNCSYVGSDTDYYRAVINTFGSIKINIKANDVYGDPAVNTASQLDFFVFDRRKENGFIQILNLYTADGTSMMDSVVLNCQGPDTLYFRLYSRSAYDYELSYSTTGDSALFVDDEPNNSFSTAKRIQLNDTNRTNVGYYNLEVLDNVDYYKTSLPSKGTVRIFVQAQNTSNYGGYLNATVYDRRQALGFLFSKYVGNSTSIPAGNVIYDTITLSCVNTDTLFISWQSQVCFKYTFRVEHINRAPSANFEFTKTGNLYEFTNTSNNSSTYRWDFGNGTTSTLPNPPLKSFTPGIYSVKLIANNTTGCNYADTVIKSVTIKGIERYTPLIGGNGNLLFSVYGGGFNGNTILKLKRGSTVYTDSGRSVNRYGNIYTSIMDMHNAAIGLYDVEITTSDSTYRFINGFQLQQYKDSLRVELLGNDIVRAGDTNVYKIRVYNNGNTVAGNTEVFILLPSNVNIHLIDSLIIPHIYTYVNPDTISQVISVSTLDGFPIDGDLYSYIINGIPQNGYKDITFLMNFPLGQQPVFVYAKGPYDGSNFRFWLDDCWKARFEFAYKFINGVVDLLSYNDNVKNQIKQCALDLWKLGLSSAGDQIVGNAVSTTQFEKAIKPISQSKNYVSAILNCSIALGYGLAYTIPIVKLIDKASKIYDIETNGRIIYDAYINWRSKCADASKDKFSRNIQSRTSLDPNSISGPTGFKNSRYINRNKKIITYTVSFENLQTATLPAQRVVIFDTLDGNVFDFKTLKILSLGIGRRSYSVPVENKEFITDVTIDSSLFVRLNIKLDTLTGILKANFKTIDRATGLATINPLAGFLPPNVHSPEGQGYFTYSIELKNSVSHGTIINNKASIVFDNNSPILTNTWSNTIDTIQPVSTITSLTRLSDTTARFICNGTDANSGVESYRLYGSKSGSPFEWLGNISDTAMFYGQKDSSYAFYILAVDSVGNIENKAAVAEATINFGTLPVSMLPLKGIREASGNKLYWSTVTEQNNKGFYVERSEDGRTFNTIGFVLSSSANGNSNAKLNYSYTDENAPKKTYYKLKQIDKDSGFVFSNIVYIDRGSALNISVYPNPTKNEIFINSDNRLTEILVTDLSGKAIKRLVPSATNRYSIADVQNGIYILKLATHEGSQQTKIIVSR